MSDFKPRLHDEDSDLDVFKEKTSIDDRPSIRQDARAADLELIEAEAMDDTDSNALNLGGSVDESLDDGLVRPPVGGLDFDETEARSSGEQPEFNPDAINEEDDEEEGDNLDFQLDERPDLSVAPPEDDGPELDFAGSDDEISVTPDAEDVVPELASAETRDEIVLGDLIDDDKPPPAVPEPEQEEPVIAEDSSATPVEESEPVEEPESDPGLPAPRPPDGDSAFDEPDYRVFDDSGFELEAVVVEPEYEINLDLNDDGEDGE